MEHNKYDLMGAVLKSPGFGENLYYPEHLMGYSYSLLIYNKNDQNIKGFDIKSLEGKTIGVFAKATDKIKRLNNVLEFNDIKAISNITVLLMNLKVLWIMVKWICF